MSEDEPFVFETGRTKVQQQRARETGSFEVVEHLRFFGPTKARERLELHEHLAKADEI